MGRQIILYSNDCKRCNLVKRMLDAHQVEYAEIKDQRIIAEKDFESAPVLEIDGKAMEYQAILTWLRENNYYSLWGDDSDSN